jgi:hypothetical protein
MLQLLFLLEHAVVFLGACGAPVQAHTVLTCELCFSTMKLRGPAAVSGCLPDCECARCRHWSQPLRAHWHTRQLLGWALMFTVHLVHDNHSAAMSLLPWGGGNTLLVNQYTT